MGNYYANFAVRGAEQSKIVDALRGARRRALVAPTYNQITLVFERDSDRLIEAEIDLVGALLSCHHPVLAAAVADDDELWLGLYQQGARTVNYSSRGERAGTLQICRAFGRWHVIPLVWIVLQFPYVVFESLRHAALAQLLGIPNWCVATGYRYIVDNEELPPGLSAEDLTSTD